MREPDEERTKLLEELPEGTFEGEVVLHREEDGRVVVETAPPTARMALELLQQSDAFLVRVSGNTIRLAGQVIYRVVGWDEEAAALLLERLSPDDAEES